MVTPIQKSDGKRLHPWEIANVSFHAEEEERARHQAIVRSARLVPQEQRKKWNGKDLFEPGEIFFMTMPTGKGPQRVPHVYTEPVVDVGDHYEVLDRKTNKLYRRLTSAIAVRTGF